MLNKEAKEIEEVNNENGARVKKEINFENDIIPEEDRNDKRTYRLGISLGRREG